MRPEVKTKYQVTLIANLLGWETRNGEIYPPNNISHMIYENGESCVNMIIDDEGIIFNMPEINMAGLWSEGLFSIYDTTSPATSMHEVIGNDVESGLSFMFGIRWTMKKLGTNTVKDIENVRSRANRLSVDEIKLLLGSAHEDDNDEEEAENYS